VPGAAGDGGKDALAALASDTAVEDEAPRHQVGESIEEIDPVAEAAEVKTSAALQKLNYYDSLEAVMKALAVEVTPSHKVLVLVDAQTSKHRVGHKLVEMATSIMARGGGGHGGHNEADGVGKSALGGIGQAPLVVWRGWRDREGALEAEIPGTTRVVITAGPRLDYLLAVGNKAKVSLSGMTHYTVQLVAGTTQGSSRHAAYVHFAHDNDYAGPVPTSINSLAARAKHGECTRLRCVEHGCPLRPEGDRKSLAEVEDPRGRDRARRGGFGMGRPGCLLSARVGA
jgi:hypothetical protein